MLTWKTLQPALAAFGAAVLLVAGFGGAFGYLFGGGAVLGQETGAWATTRAVVQTRVLGSDLVKLSDDRERYVARGDEGRAAFFQLMQERGFRHVEQMGAGHFYVGGGGVRCVGGSRQFTSRLMVYDVPTCRI